MKKFLHIDDILALDLWMLYNINNAKYLHRYAMYCPKRAEGHQPQQPVRLTKELQSVHSGTVGSVSCVPIDTQPREQ